MCSRHSASCASRSRPRRVAVGDVVDRAAERIDLEHRLALLALAGCAWRDRTSCRRREPRRGDCSSQTSGIWTFMASDTVAAGVDARSSRRNRLRAAPLRGRWRAPAALLRCTRSLKGSRTCNSSSSRAASAWMTEISIASRVSFTLAGRSAALFEQGGGARGKHHAGSRATPGWPRCRRALRPPMPCAASASSGI